MAELVFLDSLPTTLRSVSKQRSPWVNSDQNRKRYKLLPRAKQKRYSQVSGTWTLVDLGKHTNVLIVEPSWDATKKILADVRKIHDLRKDNPASAELSVTVVASMRNFRFSIRKLVRFIDTQHADGKDTRRDAAGLVAARFGILTGASLAYEFDGNVRSGYKRVFGTVLSTAIDRSPLRDLNEETLDWSEHLEAPTI